MWVYWVLYCAPAVVALGFVQTRATDSLFRTALWFYALAVVIIVGLRFEVGVDWINYLNHIQEAESYSFLEVVAGSDPGYGLLSWLSAKLGLGVWFPNLVSAALFMGGTFVFCKNLPNPWLAITVAVPYMVIVLAMNYTRQGAAFGIVLLGLAFLQRGMVPRYLALIVLAALFHKTAALLLPLAFFQNVTTRLGNILLTSAAAITGYAVFVSEYQSSFYETYILEQYSSEGAAARVAMNSVAALVFLFFRKRAKMKLEDEKLWTKIAIVTLTFIPLLIFSPSSTAVDRMALYFMPIQLVAWSYLPVVTEQWGLKRIAVVGIVLGYWLVMYIWFNYAVFSSAWIPYQFYPTAGT